MVRIEAKLRDYVVDAQRPPHQARRAAHRDGHGCASTGRSSAADDHWILASIEQGAEGEHALERRVVADAVVRRAALRDEALVEGAVADAVPEGIKIAEVADLAVRAATPAPPRST